METPSTFGIRPQETSVAIQRVGDAPSVIALRRRATMRRQHVLFTGACERGRKRTQRAGSSAGLEPRRGCRRHQPVKLRIPNVASARSFVFRAAFGPGKAWRSPEGGWSGRVSERVQGRNPQNRNQHWYMQRGVIAAMPG